MNTNLGYAWKPHNTNFLFDDESKVVVYGADTREEVEAAMEGFVYFTIDHQLFPQVNDAIYLAIYSGLRHTTNRETWGLANDRIPQNDSLDQTLQFLIAYFYEKDNGIHNLIEYLKGEITYSSGTGKYHLPSSARLRPTLLKWTERADKITELLDTARSKVGGFAAYADFVRDWAMIELGEVTGLELTTAGNSVQIGYDRVTTESTTLEKSELQPTFSVKIVKLKGIWQTDAMRTANTTDTVTITAKNGPNQFRIKTGGTWGRWVTLLPNSTHTFPKAQLVGSDVNIESRPILIPTAERELADVTLAVGVTESVDIAGLFGGLNINITAVSSNTNKATVQVNSSQTSMGIVGVAVGSATISVTAGNLAGTQTVTFDVTVTAAASD